MVLCEYIVNFVLLFYEYLFQLNGIVREYTFSRLDLHDGVKYIVHMISCNRAKLCTESKSDPILVDSSPPTPGMIIYVCVDVFSIFL